MPGPAGGCMGFPQAGLSARQWQLCLYVFDVRPKGIPCILPRDQPDATPDSSYQLADIRIDLLKRRNDIAKISVGYLSMYDIRAHQLAIIELLDDRTRA